MNPAATWHVFHSHGDELESLLNTLANDGHKIFSVQFTGDQWFVITEKAPTGDTGKVPMGFNPKRV